MATARRSEGTPLPKVASLHEQTVQAAARGEVESKRPRRNNGRRTLATTTRDDKIPDLAMAEALRLAGGDCGRITFTPEGEVVVLNNKRGS